MTSLILTFLFALNAHADALPASEMNASKVPSAMEPAAKPATAPENGSVKMAKVMFTNPTEGQTVSKTFKAQFAAEGIKIVKAGTVTPGEGHFILIVDGAAVPKGKMIKPDSTHIHLANGEADTSVVLKPGKHVLTVQLADGAHNSYGEMMSQTIHIKVK